LNPQEKLCFYRSGREVGYSTTLFHQRWKQRVKVFQAMSIRIFIWAFLEFSYALNCSRSNYCCNVNDITITILLLSSTHLPLHILCKWHFLVSVQICVYRNDEKRKQWAMWSPHYGIHLMMWWVKQKSAPSLLIIVETGTKSKFIHASSGDNNFWASSQSQLHSRVLHTITCERWTRADNRGRQIYKLMHMGNFAVE